MDTMKFVLLTSGKKNSNNDIITREALLKTRDTLLEKKTIELKDSKGTYTSKVHQAFIEGDQLLVIVDVR